MSAYEFIEKLRSQGRYSFTVQEMEQVLQLNKIAAINALHRLRVNKMVISPARGFYLIIPPEYQAFGCLPADMFIPDLMKHFHQPYYVGFLSAAQYYGAAHQKPQRFQVVTIKNRQLIQCGRIHIEFIANKYAASIPFKKFNTLAGSIAVATPEVIAADIINAPHHAAGINNAATVLTELAEKIEIKKLIELSKLYQELSWLQRLGYLFEFLGFNSIANKINSALAKEKLNWVLLSARAPYKISARNRKWKIIVNTEVEID
jgi:predicted transcriptional regulator of viral defense system